jgi:hypothetical protein
MGILDPTKVTRAALQHAASISGLMITTEALGRSVSVYIPGRLRTGSKPDSTSMDDES